MHTDGNLTDITTFTGLTTLYCLKPHRVPLVR